MAAIDEYVTLDKAYKYFNEHLFGGQLPDCIITLQHGKPKSLGYFHFEKFQSRDGKDLLSELALNPDRFNERTDIEILSTVAHEMAHVWQAYVMGETPRNGYHDKVWGAEMQEIGLMPSNTGEPGGKATGQQMTHYIIEGGNFEIAAGAFLLGHKLSWNSQPPLTKEAKKKKQTRVKYVCPDCMTNIWAKPGIEVTCTECQVAFVPEETGEKD